MTYGETAYTFDVFDGEEWFASGEAASFPEAQAGAGPYIVQVIGDGREARVVFYERREIITYP
jgi:hypothetical protein